jgi:pimeloyl-ACP methyl ester carboxylesterase
MLDPETSSPTTLIMLHFLGGSGRSWRWVTAGLPGFIHPVAVDLPGFGDAASLEGYSVAEMVAVVAARVRAERPRRWVLAGHSMGAKVAMAVARRAEDGEAGLQGLAGLVLLAGSPPGPEPMDDARRAAMRGWFASDAATSRAEAEGYIAGAIGGPLTPAIQEVAVGDVLRSARPAWVAWLDQGSREDHSAGIGVLRTPALIVAGSEDADLGPDAQRRLTAPHLARHRLEVAAGAGHLLPMERPELVARLIAGMTMEASEPAGAEIAPAYLALIRSDRVSTRTREALLARGAPDDPQYRPAALDARQLAVLRAVVARIVPQDGVVPIDLAARIDASLAEGVGDGWRLATQPPDADAYRAGLDALDEAGNQPFAALDADAQDAFLRRVEAGEGPAGRMTAAQMADWFGELCSDATRAYVSHPATLARLGFSGVGIGGDEAVLPGFACVGVGEREAWEPEALGEAAP